MRYSSGTLNSNWHVDREAEPKDYNVLNDGNAKKDLQRSTYQRIGNLHDELPLETTATKASKEVFDLKDDYKHRIERKHLVDTDNFDQTTTVLETGAPSLYGHSTILPHHAPEHGLRYLEATQRRDYVYPYKWKPENAVQSSDKVQETSIGSYLSSLI
eukprot:Em0023g30a